MTDTVPEQSEAVRRDEGGQPTPTREGPLDRHRRVLAAAEDWDFVISHRILRSLGVSRQQAARQVLAGRWTRCGTQTFAVHTGPLGFRARCWRGVWETGERIAAVDGVSSLQLAGLKGWDEEDVVVGEIAVGYLAVEEAHGEEILRGLRPCGPMSCVAVHGR